ncbi:GNAT family N-acetyltransferase [Aestuariibacter halophilus]|uniref:GNAT family N-acetyltransferase n=1 Tax=Fluctibacter halophilus TaxID=226011 RepID=A0ABS8G3N3_9ALTE|nr:GNAT family N-acetyltransferase [Aestuariibacter halophilus]MCC2615109.1 GNAT family N-acetyltransferase [Aestuariibacter halophilus]
MILQGYQVTLTPVGEDDLDLLRQWRNDPDIARQMLSQEPISEEQQQAWFKKISRDPAQQHFVIRFRDEPIGSANIKACGPGKTLKTATTIEPGLYIGDPRYRQNILAFAPTLVLNDYCFEQLGVQQLRAVVKATNTAALNYNQKLGYRTLNSGDLVEITLNFEDYQQHTRAMKALLSRSATRTNP